MNRLITIMLALISCGCVSTRETSEQVGKQLFRFEKDGRFGFKDGAGMVEIQLRLLRSQVSRLWVVNAMESFLCVVSS